MKEGRIVRDDFEKRVGFWRIWFQIHGWGSIVEKREGGRKVTALCSLSKSLHSRGSAFWETRVCVLHARRGRLGWNVTLPSHLCRGWPVKASLRLVIFLSATRPTLLLEKGGGRRTWDTRINYFFFVLLFFPASPCPAISRDVTDRGLTYNQKFPRRMPTLFPKKISPEIQLKCRVNI